MSIKNYYYNFRAWFRYYFIRKKSPISYIWWSDILKRDIRSVGMYQTSIAATTPDCAIGLSSGAPSDNHMTICIYDSDDKLVDRVEIKLSYKSMRKIMNGYDRAFAISRAKIKEENEL